MYNLFNKSGGTNYDTNNMAVCRTMAPPSSPTMTESPSATAEARDGSSPLSSFPFNSNGNDNGNANSSSMNSSSSNNLPTRSSLRNDASGLPPCLRRFHEQRKRASEEVHHHRSTAGAGIDATLLALPPAFQCMARQKVARQQILKDLTCDSAIPGPRLRIQRNLSLKRATWQQLVRSTEQIETLKMLKEVARQAKLLAQEAVDEESRKRCTGNGGNNSLPPPPTEWSPTSPIPCPKKMIQISTHNRSSKQSKRRQQQQQRKLKIRRRNEAAVKIQAGYRMYRCRVIYLRDIAPRRERQERTRVVVERKTSEITMSDFDGTRHTLEDMSLHLLMQKASRHTHVSDLHDSFESMGELVYSPKTNMERNNFHNSLSSSLQVALISGDEGAVDGASKPPLPSPPNLLGNSFSSLPVRPAMLSSRAAVAAAAAAAANDIFNKGHRSYSSFFAKDDDLLDRPPLVRLDASKSFRRKPEDNQHPPGLLLPKQDPTDGEGTAPLKDFSTSGCNGEGLSRSIRSVHSCHSASLSSLFGDAPAKRPNRLPSTHVRKDEFDTDDDDDSLDSDDITLDAVSFSEEVVHDGRDQEEDHDHEYGHDNATTTTITSSNSEDLILKLEEEISLANSSSFHMNASSSDRWSTAHGSIPEAPFLNSGPDSPGGSRSGLLSRSDRWSVSEDQALDMNRLGHMSCPYFINTPDVLHGDAFNTVAATKAPDTPVVRPIRKLSPNHPLSCPERTRPSVRRPEPEEGDVDDLASPRVPKRRLSRNALLNMAPRLEEDDDVIINNIRLTTTAASISINAAAAISSTCKPSQDAPMRQPMRKVSRCPVQRQRSDESDDHCGDEEGSSVASALSTGPSLQSRLEQYVRPNSIVSTVDSFATASREDTTDIIPFGKSSSIATDNAVAQDDDDYGNQKDPTGLPPPAPSTGEGHMTPPCTAWSGDSVESIPTCKKSLETTSSSGNSLPCVSSSMMHESSPKCIMDLTTVSSSSPSSKSTTEAVSESHGTTTYWE